MQGQKYGLFNLISIGMVLSSTSTSQKKITCCLQRAGAGLSGVFLPLGAGETFRRTQVSHVYHQQLAAHLHKITAFRPPRAAIMARKGTHPTHHHHITQAIYHKRSPHLLPCPNPPLPHL